MSNKPKSAGEICGIWWGKLQRPPAGETDHPRQHTSDPGALARLRRAATPIEAASESRTIELYQSLAEGLGWRKPNGEDLHRNLTAVAVTAHILAHVRDDAGGKKTTAELLGSPKVGDQPRLSTLRFQRLSAARKPSDVMAEFRAAVSILGGEAPVKDLALATLAWCGALGPDMRDQVRLRWIYGYHARSDSTPQQAGHDVNAEA